MCECECKFDQFSLGAKKISNQRTRFSALFIRHVQLYTLNFQNFLPKSAVPNSSPKNARNFWAEIQLSISPIWQRQESSLPKIRTKFGSYLIIVNFKLGGTIPAQKNKLFKVQELAHFMPGLKKLGGWSTHSPTLLVM